MNLRAAMRRLIAIVLVVGACSAAGSAAAAPAEPDIHESVDYRDLEGASQAALVSSLRRSAIEDEVGRPFYGRTDWSLAWRYTLQGDDAICRIDGASITLKLNMSLPRWQPPEKTASELIARWNAFAAALRTHEDGHRAIALEAAHTLAKRLDALPPASSCDVLKRDIQRTANDTLKEYRTKEKRYDADTGHGRTQGAEFP